MFGRIRRLHALSKRLIATSGGRNISRSICELSKFHGPILLWPLLKIRTVSRESRPGNVILSYPIEQNPTRWIKLLQKIEVSNIPRQYRTSFGGLFTPPYQFARDKLDLWKGIPRSACHESTTRICISNLRLTRILTQQFFTTLTRPSTRLGLCLVDPDFDFGPWLGGYQLSSSTLTSARDGNV